MNNSQKIAVLEKLIKKIEATSEDASFAVICPPGQAPIEIFMIDVSGNPPLFLRYVMERMKTPDAFSSGFAVGVGG